MTSRKPLDIFLSVEKALFMRELGMRFSTGKAGMFWTFMEPFIQVLAIVAIKLFLFGRNSDTFDFAVFLALNFTAFNMFKNIVKKSLDSFKANKGLMIYKQVKPIDTIIARALVELFLSGTIIIIFILLGLYLNRDMYVDNLPMVVFAFIWIFIFAISVGLFFGIANTFYMSVGKVVNVGITFLMFGSAVFYSISMVPINLQKYLLINPITHLMEMLHGFYFNALDDRYVDYYYITFWTFFILFLALIYYRKFERKIISL